MFHINDLFWNTGEKNPLIKMGYLNKIMQHLQQCTSNIVSTFGTTRGLSICLKVDKFMII